jgi:cytochrome P450
MLAPQKHLAVQCHRTYHPSMGMQEARAHHDDDGDGSETGGGVAAEIDDHGYVGVSRRMIAALSTVEPQSVHHEMTQCPVHPGADGGLIFTRAEDIRSLCRRQEVLWGSPHHTMGSSRKMLPLELDGAEHTRLRHQLDPVFAPARMASLEPAIRALTDELIDGFIDDGEADVYARFCQILPATVFLRLMGLPMSDFDRLNAFKDAIVRHDPSLSWSEAAERRAAAAADFDAFMRQRIAERRADPAPHEDVLSTLLSVELDGAPMPDDTIIDVARLLVAAGLDTVAAGLSLDLCWLARHPAERDALVAAPHRWSAAVEELLRHETIIPVVPRWAATDFEFDGRKISAGTSLTMSLAAANTDSTIHPDPLTVDLDRNPNKHATFALGFHRCLGSHLARLELRVALDQFHRRIPRYRIKPGAELRYEAIPIRLVAPLPLVWSS